MDNVIHRNMALLEMEVREAGGRPVYFSVSFYTASGHVRVMPLAQTCGWRNNLSAARIRNFQEYDALGLPVGRPVAVSIDLLRTFNNKRIII